MDSLADDRSSFWIRLRAVVLVTAIIFVVFVGRLWMLQLTGWDEYARQAIYNRLRIVWEEAPRGIIYDRNGLVLAENHPVWNVNIIPADFPRDPEQIEEIIGRLASILGPEKGTSTAEVREQIEKISLQTTPEAMLLEEIGEDVSIRAVQAIEASQYEMPGVVIRDAIQRSYPQGSVAAHLIGYCQPINVDVTDYERVKNYCYPRSQKVANGLLDVPQLSQQRIYTRNSLFGQEGVEASYEFSQRGDKVVPVLQGRRGYHLYEVYASGRPVGGRPARPIASRPADPGATVYLTIDTRVQRAAEQALAQAIGSQRAGAAVAMDVETGEIIALASMPSLDANIWTKAISPDKWQRITSDSRKPLQNKAIAGEYPPGSVFKPISAVAAFQTTSLTTDRTFRCDGSITVGRRHQLFQCWQRSGHGWTDFYKGMAQSCDVYFYELVLKAGLSSDNIARYARLFGLGSATGIDIPGEEEGFVPDEEWKQTVERAPWLTGDTLNMVIGQGWLTVTPLQMAVATAAIANGGKVLTPRVVRKIQWPQWLGGQMEMLAQPPARQLELDEKTLARVRRGMRLAVTRPQGTASMLKHLGVAVAAKTGSAQHLRNRPTHAWFICFAPYEKPKYAVAVFVWEGGGGGKTAAPIAERILAAAFGL